MATTLSNANWNIGWRVIPKSFLGALTSPLGENLSVLPGLRSIEGRSQRIKGKMQSMRWWKHLFIKVSWRQRPNRAFDDVIESKKQEDRRHPERPSMVERYIKMKPKIVWQLKKELMDRTYHLTIRPSFDRMERGKLRRITPPSFRDSVIYHAVIIALEPYLINRFYFYSLGSIPGKGPWVGLNNLQSKLKDNRRRRNIACR